MTDLGHGKRRDHQPGPVAGEKFRASGMIAVSLVEGSDKRPRVAQDHADAAPLASSRSGSRSGTCHDYGQDPTALSARRRARPGAAEARGARAGMYGDDEDNDGRFPDESPVRYPRSKPQEQGERARAVAASGPWRKAWSARVSIPKIMGQKREPSPGTGGTPLLRLRPYGCRRGSAAGCPRPDTALARRGTLMAGLMVSARLRRKCGRARRFARVQLAAIAW
jgi:hypothetical protein